MTEQTPSPNARVRVVTDSTASFPTGLDEASGIEVVPLHVVIDGQSYLEGVDCTPEQIAQALTEGARVSTSQPTREQFARVYARLAAQGATEIVSIHLSGDLSGTVHTAAAAALDAPVKVHVVDSRTAAMGLGFAALVTANAPGRSGGEATAGARAARTAMETAQTMNAVFLVDSIEHLRRGGRLGRAASTVGTLLGLRPLLTLDSGRIDVLAKVRTRAAAIERMGDLAIAQAQEAVAAAEAGSGAGEGAAVEDLLIAVHHVGAQEAADDLARRIEEQTGTDVVVSSASAVLGAHVGPGMLSTIVGQRRT